MQLGTIIKSVALMFERKYKTSAFFLGLCLVFALPPSYFLLSAFIAFSGLLYLCYKAETLKQAAAVGYWFGFGFFLYGLSWVGNALLIDIKETGILYPIALIASGAFFGLFTMVPAMATKAVKPAWAKVVLFAAVWGIVVEWFRGFFLTGFPWNPISSVWAFSSLMLQALSVLGTYGFSVVTVLIAALPSLYLLKRNYKNAIKVLTAEALFFAVFLSYGYCVLQQKPETYESLTVRLVQPSIPQALKWNEQVREDNFNKYVELSRNTENAEPDFVIWGETASPFDLTNDDYHRLIAQEIIPQNGYLISGMLRFSYDYNKRRPIPYNSLAVLNADGVVIDSYDKTHLVPFGEYIPLREYLPSWVKPVANNVADFGRGLKYQTITLENFPEFVPLICYEIIFSSEVVRKENKPKWLVVLTNDGWYGVSRGPYQHLVAAQMRAVEEGIAVVRSANSGISAVISPYGNIEGSLALNETGALDVKVPYGLAHNTLFGQYGNVIMLLLCATMICAVFIPQLLFKKKN